MPFLLGLCWLVTLIACVVAAFLILGTIATAGFAPLQAAGSALAVAIVVVPYIFSRACHAFLSAYREADMLALLRTLAAASHAQKRPPFDLTDEVPRHP